MLHVVTANGVFMSSSKKIMIGDINITKFEDNLFALKLIGKLSEIDAEAINQQSRLAFLTNFIFAKKGYDLFLETVQDTTVQGKVSKKPIALGALSSFVPDEQLDIINDKIANLPVSERGDALLELALYPNHEDGDTIDLQGEDAIRIGQMLLKSSYRTRIEMLFNGANFESLKKASKNTLNIGKITITDKIINPMDSKGRSIDVVVKDEQITEAIDYVKSLDRKDLNLFMGKAIVNYVEQSKGLFFRLQSDLPYILSDIESGVFDVDLSTTIQNNAIERFRYAYSMKNNRLKDRFGASDTSMQLFKKAPNSDIKDPVTSMLTRLYVHYPELVIDSLPKQVDIRSLIEYLGGSDRSLGMYIGRNAFSAHRYLHKAQKLPQNVELLMHFFAKFVQDGRIQEYVEKIVVPEAKARGIDVFANESWGRDEEDSE